MNHVGWSLFKIYLTAKNWHLLALALAPVDMFSKIYKHHITVFRTILCPHLPKCSFEQLSHVSLLGHTSNDMRQGEQQKVVNKGSNFSYTTLMYSKF